MEENAPNSVPVSVLVCTRNRPEDLAKALPGILAQDYPNYEVVLIDQSTNEESAKVVEPYLAGSRLRYIRTATVGLSIARNLALTEARNDICAFTDDDCGVPPHWLSTLVGTYTQFPETQILFSPVHVPKSMTYRSDLCFPCLYFDDARLLEPGEIFGMGANMSMRKSCWEKVGPFDPMLGPGAPLPGSDEHDWLYRAHLIKAVIRLEPTNTIEHFAWRSREEWLRLTRTYSYGDAACMMKHLRCGDGRPLPKILRSLFYIGARGILRICQRNKGWKYEYNYVRGYWSGLWGSLRYPIDRRTRLFRKPDPPTTKDSPLSSQTA